jgi:DNA-binding MarR family transcriptional regulator
MQVIEFRNEMWDFVRSINESMHLVFQPITEQYNLTMLQAGILAEICRNGQHTVGSLSLVIGMTSGNTSSACKKLEKMGYLQRFRCLSDERCVQLKITPTGQETLNQIDRDIMKKYAVIFQNKSQADLESICLCLHQLLDILQEMKEADLSLNSVNKEA